MKESEHDQENEGKWGKQWGSEGEWKPENNIREVVYFISNESNVELLDLYSLLYS